MTTTVPAPEEPVTLPLVALVTPLVRAALDNGVELAALDAWRCPGGDDARRVREAARLGEGYL